MITKNVKLITTGTRCGVLAAVIPNLKHVSTFQKLLMRKHRSPCGIVSPASATVSSRRSNTVRATPQVLVSTPTCILVATRANVNWSQNCAPKENSGIQPLANVAAVQLNAVLDTTSITRSAAVDAPRRNAQLATLTTTNCVNACALSLQSRTIAQMTSSGARSPAHVCAFHDQKNVVKINSGIKVSVSALARPKSARMSITCGTLQLANASAAPRLCAL